MQYLHCPIVSLYYGWWHSLSVYYDETTKGSNLQVHEVEQITLAACLCYVRVVFCTLEVMRSYYRALVSYITIQWLSVLVRVFWVFIIRGGGQNTENNIIKMCLVHGFNYNYTDNNYYLPSNHSMFQTEVFINEILKDTEIPKNTQTSFQVYLEICHDNVTV